MKNVLLRFFGAALALVYLHDGLTNAADLPVKASPYAVAVPAPSWGGLYFAGFGMYGANFANANTVDNVGAGINTDLSAIPHGPGIGGELGYLYDFHPVVFGARAAIAWANMQGGATSNLGLPLSVNNATNYLGDVNAVLGLPLSPDGRLLGYFTGGFAFGGAKPNLQVATLQAAASDTSTGWDIGAGLRYLLPGNNIFVGIEGDYYKLGDRSLTATLNGTALVTSTTKYDIFVQKVEVGFKF